MEHRPAHRTPPIRIGLLLDVAPHHDLDRQLDQLASTAAVAQQCGLESVWLGESFHRHGEPFHSGCALSLLANLAPRTGLRLGTAVLLVPAYQPERLVQEISVVDQLSGGRLSVGLGLGRPRLRRDLGFTDRQRGGDVLDAFLAAAARAWRSDGGGSLLPMPRQPGGPPLLIGGTGARARARAVRWSTGFYVGTNHSDDVLRQTAAHFRKHDGHPGHRTIAISRLCLIADDDATARRQARAHFGGVVGYYQRRQLWPGPDPEQNMLVGTPAVVARKLARYREWGVTSVQLRVAPIGTPPAVAERTLRLARDVLPALARHPDTGTTA